MQLHCGLAVSGNSAIASSPKQLDASVWSQLAKREGVTRSALHGPRTLNDFKELELR